MDGANKQQSGLAENGKRKNTQNRIKTAEIAWIHCEEGSIGKFNPNGDIERKKKRGEGGVPLI